MISCTNNDKDSEYLTQHFSKSIEAIIHEYYPQYDYHINNSKITFEKKSIEITPYIEQIVNKNDQWFYGIGYEVLLNDVNREEFIYGTVGHDITKEDAIVASISEWIVCAGFPILDYFFNNIDSDNYFELENYKVLFGNTLLRGDEGDDWLDGSTNMHTKLLGLFINIIKHQSSEIYTVFLQVFREPNK